MSTDPTPVIFGAEDGPFVKLVLPLEVVRAAREVLRRHGTPNTGIDGVVIDEINHQLEQQLTGHDCPGCHAHPGELHGVFNGQLCPYADD